MLAPFIPQVDYERLKKDPKYRKKMVKYFRDCSQYCQELACFRKVVHVPQLGDD